MMVGMDCHPGCETMSERLHRQATTGEPIDPADVVEYVALFRDLLRLYGETRRSLDTLCEMFDLPHTAWDVDDPDTLGRVVQVLPANVLPFPPTPRGAA